MTRDGPRIAHKTFAAVAEPLVVRVVAAVLHALNVGIERRLGKPGDELPAGRV